MSGDESDHRSRESARGDRKYATVRPAWRSERISKWLRTFDQVYISTRFQSSGRATRGNWPRIRLVSAKVDEHARPVPSLPENFYTEAFLDSLDEEDLEALQVQPAIDLRFTRRVAL